LIPDRGLVGTVAHNRCLADGMPAARAFDFAVFDENGAYLSDGIDSRYATIGMIAANLKQVWGELETGKGQLSA
jgi:hypothetical protein